MKPFKTYMKPFKTVAALLLLTVLATSLAQSLTLYVGRGEALAELTAVGRAAWPFTLSAMFYLVYYQSDVSAQGLDLALERLVGERDDLLLRLGPDAVEERHAGVARRHGRLEAAPERRDGQTVGAAAAVARG